MLAQLQQHPLLGNVRELENLLHRAIALHEDPCSATSAAADQPTPLDDADTLQELPTDLQAWLDQQERTILTRALQACGFNRTAAAARLGISLRQMRYRIARLNIPLCPDDAPPCDDRPTDDTRY